MLKYGTRGKTLKEFSPGMKQATARKNKPTTLYLGKRLREGIFILLCSFAIYLFIALISYHTSDPAWSHSGRSHQILNAAGRTGAWCADLLYSLFGYIAYSVPCILILSGLFIYRENINPKPLPFVWSIRTVGSVFSLLGSCGLISIYFSFSTQLPMSGGGLIGMAMQNAMVTYLNSLGASVILFGFLLIGITLLTGLSWFTFSQVAGEHFLVGLVHFHKKFSFFFKKTIEHFKLKTVSASQALIVEDAPLEREKFLLFEDEKDFEEDLPLLKSNHCVSKVPSEVKKTPPSRIIVKPYSKEKSVKSPSVSFEAIPALTLLEMPEKKQRQGYSSAQLQELSQLVEMRLREFGVEVRVVGVYPGPVITRFELELAPGIKVNKITGLAKDLARSLSVVSVRVVEVIPGKSVVGIEIPNTHRELVRLKEVLEDEAYQGSESALSLALGKDIAGKPIVVDLAKMPHLLVAGTTGSGKSVGLNAMLLSILYKSLPQEVRMILIDPKMLELAVYDKIPHLLTPVVTDMKDAANALRWCVAEMERRYQMMAAIGVRNLTGYNQKVEIAIKSGQPLLDPLWIPESREPPLPLEKLPYIVVVVDEFADMMMVVGKKVEELIARIAQKARAAGIHLILATQRPSVDVITGLIKANIPTRIAFQVSSRIDSRTILDQSGAEQLLGHGDMLYLPPGTGVPYRIHGAFVSDDEVHNVTNELRRLGEPSYIESVVQSCAAFTNDFQNEEIDELYDQALAVVTRERKASISLVQRRLKIGYNRAARLVEYLESEGVVSEVQTNGMREVLAPPPVE